jgi:hypothetical protein
VPVPEQKSVPTLAAELWDLVRAYAKQETVAPVKGLGRYVARGVAGSLFLGVGGVLVVLASLRALQTESGDAFDGNWSFVPYVIVLIGSAALAVLAISRTGKKGSPR